MRGKTYYLGIIFILLSAVILTASTAQFAPYLVASVLGILLAKKSPEHDLSGKETKIINGFSAFAAVFVALANYALILHPDLPDVRGAIFVRIYKLVILLVILAGSFFCAKNILTYVSMVEISVETGGDSEKKRAYLWFVIPFAATLAIYLAVYFSCYYPGLLSPDSLDQVGQVFSGQYSNHQPFYHTMIIGLFLKGGMAAGLDINRSVMLYSLCQMTVLAATFSFLIYNLKMIGLPKWTMVVSTLWFALMPFHIMYSFTMWKDVYFGAFVTLLILFFIRIVYGIGNSAINHVGFAICGPFICLLRSNGLFAYVFVLLAMVLLLRKQKKMILIMAVTIIACFVCKHTVLSALSVTQPDTVESLSIPLQQVARVVADDGSIDDADRAFLSQILDVDALKETYDPEISDPVKNMIRDFGNEEYLTTHMKEFAALYLRTVMKNPVTCVAAWVDSTCGYWNSGYGYWVWYWDVEVNPYGIERTVSSQDILNIMDEYLWMFYNNKVLQIFTAIGFFVWILSAAFVRCIIRGNKTGIVAMVPIFAIILSLVISSPVFAEFRYMYALFCALPVLIAISFAGGKNEAGMTDTKCTETDTEKGEET